MKKRLENRENMRKKMIDAFGYYSRIRKLNKLRLERLLGLQE